MNLEDEVVAGRQAEYLLEHPAYLQAFAALRTEITQQWASSPSRDAEGRERLWMMLKLLDRIEGHIKSVAETGKMAKAQIADIEQRRRIMGIAL